MNKIITLAFKLTLFLKYAASLPLPFNEYSFILARNSIKSIDSNYAKELNSQEKIVSMYFEKLKYDEILRTNFSNFIPLKPIETQLNSIVNSRLYKELIAVPKGGNLHMHEDQMINRRQLLEIIKKAEEYDYLYICDKSKEYCKTRTCNCTNFFLTYIKNPKYANNDGWVKVKESNWSIDAILNKTTLIGILNNLDDKILPTDSAGRWAAAESYGVFGFYADLILYNKTRFDYLKACLDNSLNENVQIIDFRRANFGGLYYFNEEGDRIILSAEYEIDRLVQFKKDYIQQNPTFIDFNYILFGIRIRSKSDIQKDLDFALKTQKAYPDFIRGYDLVAEEDKGHSLLFHSDTLITGFNYSYNSVNNSFNYYFHNAETNWPTDMMPPQFGDDTSTTNNVYDALVFNTRRIGHGLGYIKHPNLYPFLRERKIAIEVCPASNQILGYVADLRNHPAVNYYKSGIPIVIAGDDPGSFGYNDLTVDYYLAYLSWGFSLFDLREIANNSIRYSSSIDIVKSNGLTKFTNLWFKFIDTTYNRICSKLNEFQNNINVTNVYPTYGPNNQKNIIVIYGYGYEKMFCQEIKCFFDEIQTDGYLNELNELACETPLGFADNQKAKLSILYGSNKIDTGLVYTFVSSNSINLIENVNNFSSKTTNMKFFFGFIIYFCLHYLS